MSRVLLAQLEEKRRTIAVQSRGILDAAAEQKRELTAQEDADFSAATAEMIALNKRAKEIVAAMEVEAEAEQRLASALGSAEVATRKADPEADLAASLRSIFTGEMPTHEVRKFAVPLGNIREAQQRALTKSANTVKVTFQDQLTQHLVDTTSVLQIATIWQTSTGENIDAPITTSHGASAGLTTEGSTFTGTDPTITKRTLGAYAYKQLILLSTELVNDASFDIVGYVAEALGINAGLALGTDIAVGNGSSKPSGVMQTTTLGATGPTGKVGAPSADSLIDLFYSVGPQYRRSPKCAWLMRDATIGQVRKLQDGSSQYIFKDFGANPLSNGEGTILGKPVYSDPNIAASALNAKNVAFGDFSKFVVRLVNGVRFERSDDYAFNSDQVAFRAVIRGDSVLLDQTGAVKHHVGAAS